MTTAEQRVRILKDENRRMERYLHGLPEEAWQHPTPCAEWMVADVIAHITSFNIVQPARIAEALRSAAPDPAAAPRRWTTRVDATVGERRAIELRAELGPDLLARDMDASRAAAGADERVG